MLQQPLPDSLDPYVLKDGLLLTLRKSPQTLSLINRRAEEVVEQILSSKVLVDLRNETHCLQAELEKRNDQLDAQTQLCQEAQQTIEALQDNIYQLEEALRLKQKENESLRSAQMHYRKQVSQLSAQAASLREELKLITSSGDQVKATVARKEDLFKGQLSEQQTIVRTLSSQIASLKERIKHEVQKRQAQRDEAAITHLNRTNELQSQLANMAEIAEALQSKNTELKGRLKNLKQQKHQLESARKENEAIITHRETELLQLKSHMESTNAQWRSQRQQLITQITNLRAFKNQLTPRLFIKLKEALRTITTMKEQMSKMKSRIDSRVKQMQEWIAECFTSVLDKLGSSLSTELSGLMAKVKGYKRQIIVLTQANEVKAELLLKLETMLRSQTVTLGELKAEIKVRKRQQSALKRKIRQHCDFTAQKVQIAQQSAEELFQVVNSKQENE